MRKARPAHCPNTRPLLLAARLLVALLMIVSAARAGKDLVLPACSIHPPKQSPPIGRTVVLRATLAYPAPERVVYRWHLGGGIDRVVSGETQGDRPIVDAIAFERGHQVFPVTLTLTDSVGRISSCRASIAVGSLPLAGSSTGIDEQDPPGDPSEQTHAVLAFSDLGMHCMDLGSRPLRIRPPLNNIQAQVVERGVTPRLLGDTEISLRYSAASNPADPVLSPLTVGLENLAPLEGQHVFAARELLWATTVEVATDADVLFSAGSEVFLGDGFSIADDAVFRIELDPSLEAPSINSTSRHDPPPAPADAALTRKSDLWDPVDPLDPLGPSVVAALFQVDPPPDEGLPTVRNPAGGRRMPGFAVPYLANQPQPFSWFESATSRFVAEGIPLTPIDDVGRLNPYPLLRIQAVDGTTDEVVAAIDTVAPVSTGVDCRDCHLRGGVGADPAARSPEVPFVEATLFGDPFAEEFAAKQNILLLHDLEWGTSHASGPPVLCATCHESHTLEAAFPVLEPADPPHLSLSNVMHDQHGRFVVDAVSEELIRTPEGEPVLRTVPEPGERFLLLSDPSDPTIGMEQSCFSCHPGAATPYFRGGMADPAGLKCSSCHGTMLAVGAHFTGDFDGTGSLRPRRPWLDEPRCESCHLGDAVDPGLDGLPARLAFDPADAAAAPTLAANDRFAEDRGASDELVLFRSSQGHGGVACAGCHGSPHAIWPHPDPAANDNVTAIQLQGAAGQITACAVCHEAGSFPGGNLEGPHGLHPVADSDWIESSGSWHRFFAQAPGDDCAPCHGVDHLGTRLSRAFADRELRSASGTLLATVAAGDVIGCDLCHALQ